MSGIVMRERKSLLMYFAITILLFACSNASCSIVSPPNTPDGISKGWNLISSPCDATLDTLKQQLGYDVLLYAWNGAGYEPATDLIRGRGYIINKNAELNSSSFCKSDISSEPFTHTYSQGWNLIGNPLHSSKPLYEVFKGIETSGFPFIYEIQGKSLVALTPLDHVKPFRGYWVYFMVDTTVESVETYQHEVPCNGLGVAFVNIQSDVSPARYEFVTIDDVNNNAAPSGLQCRISSTDNRIDCYNKDTEHNITYARNQRFDVKAFCFTGLTQVKSMKNFEKDEIRVTRYVLNGYKDVTDIVNWHIGDQNIASHSSKSIFYAKNNGDTYIYADYEGMMSYELPVKVFGDKPPLSGRYIYLIDDTPRSLACNVFASYKNKLYEVPVGRPVHILTRAHYKGYVPDHFVEHNMNNVSSYYYKNMYEILENISDRIVLAVSDESIAYIDINNDFVGLSAGYVTLTGTMDGETTQIKIHVIDDISQSCHKY